MLSPRQVAILRLLGQAKSNKEIAYELGLATGTIKEYNFRLYREIKVANRTEAALWAHDHPEELRSTKGRTEQFSPQVHGVPSSLGAATENVAPVYSEMA